ncbi:MAG: CDP-glycerol glycerophosphotransferase family protein [bacterium]|nr:CDP-glycerol glycerophosphotransferase family protein [bacterium]
MKTLIITSFHSLVSRNILHTGVLPFLLKRGLRIVLVVQSTKVDYFKEMFSQPEIKVVGVTVPHLRFEKLFTLVSMSIVGVENHKVWELKTQRKYVRFYFAIALNRLSRNAFWLHRLIRILSKSYLRTQVFDEMFSKYEPDLICTTDSFQRADAMLILTAKARGIKTLGMIRSWDNATTKGVLLSIPDRLLVPNPILKHELAELHRIPEEKVVVTGIPHYDAIINSRTLGREEFYTQMGLDPRKKTILFAPGGKILYEHDDAILANLRALKDARVFDKPVQFIVRFPPSDVVDISPVANDPDFIIDKPGVAVTGKRKEAELDRNENEHLNASLTYSDIVITLAPTMIIDAATFDLPTVVWAFDPIKNARDPIEKFARYVHLKKLFAKNVCSLAHSKNHFVELVNGYLKNPSLNKEKRDRIVDEYVYRLDGGSARRVAESIFDVL